MVFMQTTSYNLSGSHHQWRSLENGWIHKTTRHSSREQI